MNATNTCQAPPVAMTVKNAVRQYGVGRSVLYQKMKAGELESRTVGRRRLIVVSSLDRLLGLEQREAA